MAKRNIVKEAGGVGMILIDEKTSGKTFPCKDSSRKPAPRVASFSSKGPNSLTPEILKPGVTAPGLNILASWSPAAGKNFNVLSGTSMACPHVTGMAALIKAVYPSWSPSAIKSVIMTTANILDKNRKLIIVDPQGRRGNAFDYGSGFVNPTKVLDPGLVYDVHPADYKAFLCSICYDKKALHMVTRDNTSSSFLDQRDNIRRLFHCKDTEDYNSD